jgi:hypothetical protein
MSIALGLVIAGLVGIVDGRLGFIALAIVGLVALLG